MPPAAPVPRVEELASSAMLDIGALPMARRQQQLHTGVLDHPPPPQHIPSGSPTGEIFDHLLQGQQHDRPMVHGQGLGKVG